MISQFRLRWTSLVVLVLVTCVQKILSFSVSHSSSTWISTTRIVTTRGPTSEGTTFMRPKSILHMDRQSSGSAGFGKSSASSSKQNVQSRTLTGFTASGTKPLRQAATTFDRLVHENKKDGSSSSNSSSSSSNGNVHDVYVRSPLNDKNTFWFVGKVARCTRVENLKGTSVPSEFDAVVSQKRLILEYAKRELRPQNMGGPFSRGLELWLAPGNSEMDVVQNKVSLKKVEGSLSTLSQGFHVGDVGYNPEIYVGDEIRKGGLRVVRDEEGRPIKPAFEINESQ